MHRTRDSRRIAIRICGLLGGVLLLISSCSTLAEEHDRDAATGIMWRVVRQGGGPASPVGSTQITLDAVTWGGDRFVAVGWDGAILHSRDGDRWEPASDSATGQSLSGVVWNGRRFVAVGAAVVVHSLDGDRWRQATLPKRVADAAGRSSLFLSDVVWNGQRFVAVGDDGAVVHSRDGVHWAVADYTATRQSLSGVAWNGERFVAVSPNNIWSDEDRPDWVIVHSTDGHRWQRATDVIRQPGATDASRIDLRDVAWNGERFVAVGWNGLVVQSEDGDHWEQSGITAGWGTHLGGVTWNGNRFVAVGFSIQDGANKNEGSRSASAVLHSSDGLHWETAGDDVAGDGLSGVAWNRDRLVAVGWNGMIVHSADGERWEEATGSPAALNLPALQGVTWSGTRFVAVGDDGAIVHSDDAERWYEAGTVATSSTLYSVAWHDDRFVAVGDDGVIVHSSDGDSWVEASTRATANTLFRVVRGHDRFVAVGNHAIVHSRDGDRWEPASDRPPFLTDVAWTGERFVAVGGDEGFVMTSADGVHWVESTITGDWMMGLAWGNGRFVATAESILHSVDAERWELASSSMAWVARSIIWNGAAFLAVGESGQILRSLDGDRWVQVGDGVTGDTLNDVAWGEDRFVAVGWNGTIVTSR